MTAFRLTLVAVLLVAFPGASVADPGEKLGYTDDLLIQLRVSDLDASIAFYQDVVGLEMVLRNDALHWAKLWLPGRVAQVGIGAGERADGSGGASINLGVRDIEAARSVLEARGVEFAGPTIDIPGVVQLADFEDPDGNRLRLAGPPKGD